MAEKTRSEDVLGEKWDRCLSDGLIKSGDLEENYAAASDSFTELSGVGLGVVFSVIFFKRRPWPVAFGAGMGLGMAYANCQHDFNSQNLFHGTLKKIEKKAAQ